MTISVEWTSYGIPAAERLAHTITEAKGGDPLAPVTVVVPSNYVGVAARRRLASGARGALTPHGAGVAAVAFLTVYRLGELLGAARLAGTGRRPVSMPVLAAAVRGALRDEPGLFAPVADHAATEQALVAAHRELRELDHRALDQLAGASPRAAEVVRLHRTVHARLAARWYDEQDLLDSAVDVLTSASSAADDLGALVVHLPQRLSPHGLSLLSAAAERVPVTIVAGTTGEPRADLDVLRAVQALAPTAPPPPAVRAQFDANRTRIVTTSDADDEVRAAVRAIVDAARRGVPLERLAVLHASEQPYARLVHEHLQAAGIPTNGAAVLPLSARVHGRTLLAVLALADHGFRRQDVFALLAGAPVRVADRPPPITHWERVSREAAVVTGRHDWDHRLERYAHERDDYAASIDAGGDPDEAWRAERARADARTARALRSFVLHLCDELDVAAAATTSWERRVRWARRLHARVVGDEQQRSSWPAVERDAADRVERALDRLAGLDEVDGPASLATFRRTLELELDDDLARVGRFGEGVLVGRIGMGVGLDLDLVVVLGLAEGTFPARVADDSLLPDDERARAPQLALRADRTEREHRELLASLAAAPHHLLGFPRGDLRASTERVASRWLLDIASELHGARLWSAELLALDGPWITRVPSFAGGINALTFPATAQEHRLAALRTTRGLHDLSAQPAVLADVALHGGVALTAARRGTAFTRFDGNLSSNPPPAYTGATLTATRLEKWASCPHAYFVRYVLGADAVDNPEEALEITALDRGDLVHKVLEEFLTAVLQRPAEAQPGPDDPWSPGDRAVLLDVAHRWCDDYEQRGLTGRPLFWRRDRRRILADLLRFLDDDALYRRAHRTRPVAAELGFGFGNGLGAVEVPLPSGRTIRFRGRADRVDVTDAGELHIVDYKTGSTRGYTGLSEHNPDERGTKLQLPVYGLAARLHAASPDAPVVAAYWFVSAKGEWARIGFSIDDDVLACVGGSLDTIVEGIERGNFPARPEATSTTPFTFIPCEFCDPDGLGVVDRRREWERKRTDPVLASYVDLCEPPDVLADDIEVDGG